MAPGTGCPGRGVATRGGAAARVPAVSQDREQTSAGLPLTGFERAIHANLWTKTALVLAIP